MNHPDNMARLRDVIDCPEATENEFRIPGSNQYLNGARQDEPNKNQ